MKRLRAERTRQQTFLTYDCPSDIVMLIAFWLDGRELSQLAATCSDLYDIIYSSKYLAERIYYRLIWCHKPSDIVSAFYFNAPLSGKLKETTPRTIYRQYLKTTRIHDGLFGTQLQWRATNRRAFFKTTTHNYMITDCSNGPDQEAYRYARFFESIHPAAFKTWTIGFAPQNGACLNGVYGHSSTWACCCEFGVCLGSIVVFSILRNAPSLGFADYPMSFVFSYEWHKQQQHQLPLVPVDNLINWMAIQECHNPDILVVVICGTTSGKWKRPAKFNMILPKTMSIARLRSTIPFLGLHIGGVPLVEYHQFMSLATLREVTGRRYIELVAEKRKRKRI